MGIDPSVSTAVAEAHRREWAYVLASAVRVARDIDLAEECVQETYATALTAWSSNGIPTNPGAWLTTAARRKVIDRLRRDDTARRKLPLLIDRYELTDPADLEAHEIGDERLRLVFICCHPGLSRDAQVALTLRLLCGLSTGEVARAFLISEPTMAARIGRAKKKISVARIPYRVPAADDLPQRVSAVCEVVHLLFTTGHAAPWGDRLVRDELIARALDLARMLHQLLPADPEITGLLALLLLTDARRSARTDENGELVVLSEQDRSQWDRFATNEGIALVRTALQQRPPSRFALMAAVAAVHNEAESWEDTDWTEIVGLYDALAEVWPSPVVALNRAVAVGFADGPEAGLAELRPLGDEHSLAGYGYLAVARAEFLQRLDRYDEARLAYEEGILLTENAVERRHLEGRLAELPATRTAD